MAIVMIVDDQLVSRIVLEEVIKTLEDDIQCYSFESPVNALEWVKKNPVDLILADYKMPHLDGVELTSWLRKIPPCADVPIIIVTAYEDADVKYRALKAGASDFLTKPINHHECRARCLNLLTMQRQQEIIRQKAFSLEKEIEGKTKELQLREKESLLQLAKISLYRDQVAQTHLLYMSYSARLIAETMGHDSMFCEAIEYAAPLYDIGKIGISDQILKSTDKLDSETTILFQQHTQIGHDLLIDSSSNYLRLGAKIALNHHEKYDGSGYPNGLTGDDIPTEAAIIGLLDTFNDLLNGNGHEAPYRPDEAIAYIEQHKDQHYASQYVEAFSQCAEQIVAARDLFAQA